DEIRHEIEKTRTDLINKLETLENEVFDTVHGARAAVTDTVTTVKNSVTDTVETIKQAVQDGVASVKSTLDITHQVERHPWGMMGGSLAAGYVLGTFLPGHEMRSRREIFGDSYAPSTNGN